MSEAEFQALKGAAVGVALLFAGVLQLLLPYKPGFKDLVLNWRVNFPLALLNLVVVSVACGGCVCLVAQWADDVGFGLLNLLQIATPGRAVLGVLALDFTAYAWHRANHRVPLLWRFHAVHHTDRTFDVSTAVRFHPGEILASLGVRILVVGALGIPVVGILAFEMVYAGFNFFEHGNIRCSARVDRLLSLAFITPAIHRKHHSVKRAELDSNYGTIFSLWDRWLRTHVASSSEEEIAVGLPGNARPDGRILALLAMPFHR